jgi:hypothetical protein
VVDAVLYGLYKEPPFPISGEEVGNALYDLHQMLDYAHSVYDVKGNGSGLERRTLVSSRWVAACLPGSPGLSHESLAPRGGGRAP